MHFFYQVHTNSTSLHLDSGPDACRYVCVFNNRDNAILRNGKFMDCQVFFIFLSGFLWIAQFIFKFELYF